MKRFLTDIFCLRLSEYIFNSLNSKFTLISNSIFKTLLCRILVSWSFTPCFMGGTSLHSEDSKKYIPQNFWTNSSEHWVLSSTRHENLKTCYLLCQITLPKYQGSWMRNSRPIWFKLFSYNIKFTNWNLEFFTHYWRRFFLYIRAVEKDFMFSQPCLWYPALLGYAAVSLGDCILNFRRFLQNVVPISAIPIELSHGLQTHSLVTITTPLFLHSVLSAFKKI